MRSDAAARGFWANCLASMPVFGTGEGDVKVPEADSGVEVPDAVTAMAVEGNDEDERVDV